MSYFKMKLPSGTPEQNVFLTYICTVNEGKPTKDERNIASKSNKLFEDIEDPENFNQEVDTIKVEKSKALYELVDAHANEEVAIIENYGHSHVKPVQSTPTTSNDENESSENDEETTEGNANPRMLSLTKMKWLTEGREGASDSRSPSLSLSPATSSTSSQCSRESESDLGQSTSFGDKYLSTIIRLDKEHNLFGLSNIAIAGSKVSKKPCKKDEKAVFHQTAIVQVCCRKGCGGCRYRSKTDLPSSLLGCSSCSRYCCPSWGCQSCALSCVDPFICPPSACSSCLSSCYTPKIKCFPPKCFDRRCNYGVKLTLKTKPKYEPHPGVELTPRASCVLAKPQMARPCRHNPPCLAPSHCCPYLMPCYWPARAGAPCTNPTRCFHNPPCPPRRQPRPESAAAAKCPQTCGVDNAKKCPIMTCLGNVTNLSKEINARFGNKK